MARRHRFTGMTHGSCYEVFIASLDHALKPVWKWRLISTGGDTLALSADFVSMPSCIASAVANRTIAGQPIRIDLNRPAFPGKAAVDGASARSGVARDRRAA